MQAESMLARYAATPTRWLELFDRTAVPGPVQPWPRAQQCGLMDNDALGRLAAPVRDLLAVHAAPRERTADDHMFAVTSWNRHRTGTFRLQLFTAPGDRPVTVATQLPAEGGALGQLG